MSQLTPEQIYAEGIKITGNQKNLARAIGQSASTVNRWLTKKKLDRTLPDAGSALRLAKVIGRSPSSVLRACGHDPEALGIKDEPDGEPAPLDPQQVINQSIAQRVERSSMGPGAKQLLRDKIIPLLEELLEHRLTDTNGELNRGITKGDYGDQQTEPTVVIPARKRMVLAPA